MMAGETVSSEPTLLAPTGIAVRESSDTYAAHSPEVARMVRFMMDHCEKDIRIADLVELFGGSRVMLFDAFKSEVGQTPAALLNRVRVDKARQMLQTTDDKVYEVAAACGFGEPVNMHRAFQKHVGQTPNAYRKAARAEVATP